MSCSIEHKTKLLLFFIERGSASTGTTFVAEALRGTQTPDSDPGLFYDKIKSRKDDKKNEDRQEIFAIFKAKWLNSILVVEIVIMDIRTTTRASAHTQVKIRHKGCPSFYNENDFKTFN